MIADTGSTRTIITPYIQEQLSLEVLPGAAIVAGGERVTAARTVLARLEIARYPETAVDNLPVRVMNLPFADGALGLDYLSHFAEVCYSFADSALRPTSY